MDHGAANLTAMRGVGAAGGPARPRQATTKVLQSVLRGIAGSSLKDVRDRALFALRIAGALRAASIRCRRATRRCYRGGWSPLSVCLAPFVVPSMRTATPLAVP